MGRINYKCRYKNSAWTITIDDVWSHHDYTEFTVQGRGSRIRCYIGRGHIERWICFPEINKSCGLAELTDTFWNMEKLADILGNLIDAASIIGSIECLNEKSYFQWE